MYDIIKIIHSYWNFLAFLIILAAILNSIFGKVLSKDFVIKDLRISLFALIFSHIQLFISLILYFVSPSFNKWSNLGMGVINNSETRLYLIERPIANIISVILITIGWSLHTRQFDSSKKFLRIALFYSIGLVILFHYNLFEILN